MRLVQRPVVRIQWTKRADADLAELLDFIGQQPWGNPEAREAAIRTALQALADAPATRRTVKTIGQRKYCVLIVEGRFLIPYICYPPTGNRSYAILSVRAVRHGARDRPLRGVREEVLSSSL